MNRRLLYVLIALTVLAFGLRVWGIAEQVPTSDDLGVAFSAGNWVQHGQPDPTMPFHPRLRDFLVTISMAVFGTGVVGLKGWSVLLGTLTVPLLFGIVWRVSKNLQAATIAGALLALDGVSIDYSRQAIQEIHVAFFALLGTLLVLDAVVRGPSARWRWLLPLAGVAYGLGAASKYYAIPVLVVSVGVLLFGAWRRRAADEAVLVIGALVFLPAAVFLATYIPWFNRGYSFLDWLVYQRALVEAMVTHTRETGYVAFSEPAAWFVQPLNAFVDAAVGTDGRRHLAIATGNPVVWLAILPGVAYSLVFKRHRKSHQLLQFYFWASYLPLALSSRPVWVLSSVVVVPFGLAILSLSLTDLGRRFGSWLVWSYLAVALVTSAALYPLAVGRSLEHAYLRPIVERVGAAGLFGAGSGVHPADSAVPVEPGSGP